MDVFLPILIAIVVFGFQIYSNFKKEQEKAKKRYTETATKPKRPVANTRMDEALPKPEPSIKRYNGLMEEAAEVKQSRMIHKPHRHEYERLEPYQMHEEGSVPFQAEHFDLRDAVIQSAILNRPYA